MPKQIPEYAIDDNISSIPKCHVFKGVWMIKGIKKPGFQYSGIEMNSQIGPAKPKTKPNSKDFLWDLKIK